MARRHRPSTFCGVLRRPRQRAFLRVLRSRAVTASGRDADHTPRRSSRSTTVPTILAAVTNVLAAITAVFQPVTYILATIAHVLEAIAPAAVVQCVASVLATVTDILSPVTPIFATIPHVLAPITYVFATVADVLEAVTARGRGSVVKLGMDRAWVAGLNGLCERQWRGTSEQGRGDRSDSEIAHRNPQRQNHALATVACAAHATLANRHSLSAIRSAISSVWVGCSRRAGRAGGLVTAMQLDGSFDAVGERSRHERAIPMTVSDALGVRQHLAAAVRRAG